MTRARTSRRKLLLVSSWAPPDIGGPQNLYALFSQFPSESYAILTSYFSEAERKRGAWLPCDYYYYDHAPILRSDERPSARAVRVRPPRLLVSGWSMTKGFILGLRPAKAVALSSQYFFKLLRFVLAGLRTVQRVQPETIVGISDTGPAMLTAYWLSRWRHRRLIYFLFDIYRGNNHEPPAGWIANRYERRMFSSADRIIVTNEGTQAYYRERYPELADRFVVIHNSVFPELYPATPTPYRPSPPYRILFTGHIYWAQERSVINLIRAMDELRDEPVTLELYVPNHYGAWLKEAVARPNVRLHRAIPHEEIAKVQAQADILFLPLAWKTAAPDIIRTATPGKLTDYLASGRPMLIHAPPYAYVSQYGRRQRIAEVVETEERTALLAGIRRLLHDQRYAQRLIENARRAFSAHHDARANAKKLMGLLEVEKTPPLTKQE